MEIAVVFTTVIFSMALALGVGSSTSAIFSFFVAIADGTINPDERRIMRVVYIELRIAMVLLLLTSLLLTAFEINQFGMITYSASVLATWILLFVLYVNAILMTLRVMPSAFGPSIQAGTWYTFGIISTLGTLGVIFTTTQFIGLYISIVLFMTLIVNGVIIYFEQKRLADKLFKNK